MAYTGLAHRASSCNETILLRRRFVHAAIFGKVGRLAAETVTVELPKSKCLPSLCYGLRSMPSLIGRL